MKELYTARLGAYRAFISFFCSQQAIRGMLGAYGLLRPDLRVLDAGCGCGTTTFALLDAMGRRHMRPQLIDAFDLTPAMLACFQEELDARGIRQVRLRQADVLGLEELPASWCEYDLIVSTSMLEYLGKADLSRALLALQARLKKDGRLVVVITRKNWITKILIEQWWRAERFTDQELRNAFAAGGFPEVLFARFPLRYFWQNFSNYVVVAKRGAEASAGAVETHPLEGAVPEPGSQ